MASHMREPIKGSTVIISVMFATICAYIALDVWCYKTLHSWIPYDGSALVGACFVVETVNLAKLKMAKEDGRRPNYSSKDSSNGFTTKLGLSNLPDFSEEAAAAQQTAGQTANSAQVTQSDTACATRHKVS